MNRGATNDLTGWSGGPPPAVESVERGAVGGVPEDRPPFVPPDVILLDVVLHGPAVGAARPRVCRSGRVFMPDKSVRWEEMARQVMALHWRGRPALDEPLAVEVLVLQARPQRLDPQRHPKSRIPLGRIRATSKPDLDNVAKLVMDAATKAGIWADDTRVCELTARRWYVAIGELERVEVRVRRAI